jgi:hypothetical protein
MASLAPLASQASRLRDSQALDVPAPRCESLGEAGDRAYRLRPGSGLDCVELRLAAGPGEPLRPLSAVASGGESARVMLALKAAPTAAAPARPRGVAGADAGELSTADADAGSSDSRSGDEQGEQQQRGASGAVAAVVSEPAAPLMVLDELDSGIGSRLGNSVGAMLRRMAGGGVQPSGPGCQIICVTHLPQVGRGTLCMLNCFALRSHAPVEGLFAWYLNGRYTLPV